MAIACVYIPRPSPAPPAPEHTVRRAFRQAAAEATRNYSTGFGPCGRHGVLGPTATVARGCARPTSILAIPDAAEHAGGARNVWITNPSRSPLRPAPPPQRSERHTPNAAHVARAGEPGLITRHPRRHLGTRKRS